jgi:hypothetical protein
MDQVIALQLIHRVWNAAATPVTLLLLTRSLTGAEQGIYYSFGSVQALSVMFELGFAFVLSQFAAHENALLEHPERGEIAAARLGSLLHLGLRWNGLAGLFSLTLLFPFGAYFFSGTLGVVHGGWLWPWLIFTAASAALVALAPFHAVLEGAGHLAQVSLIRLLQGLGSTVILWTGFSVGWGLYALAVSQLAGFAVSAVALAGIRGGTLLRIWRSRSAAARIDYRTEVWPMHWRVALSWLAGYVGFYLSTPLIFKALSPEDAGRYGMTFGLMLSISNVAAIWMNARAPQLARLAARGELAQMRAEFEGAAFRSGALLLSAYLVLGCAIWAYPAFGFQLAFFERLLTGWPLVLLAVSMACLHGYGLVNAYFRAFKADPLFAVSISSAIAAGLLLFLARQAGSLLIIVAVPLISNFVAAAIAVHRYRSKI